MSRLEVVEVTYDPEAVAYEQLAQLAKSEECANVAFAGDAAQEATLRKVFGERVRKVEGQVTPDKEPKYYLSRTPFAHLPMTELQAVRINASLKQEPERFLSPRQRTLLAEIRAQPKVLWPSAVGVELAAAWEAAETARKRLVAEPDAGK